ncbi:MAG TPA: tRNA pseudouridine(55) synthase TruB [Gemmatimonadaceae bacterium]|nr:tRNA pseudouridine(55) synthase TruB [Gemmatimonadaceae bacterium]
MSARPEGLLLVDKPAGVTSHDVVQLVRRAYGERSIGHLGTLDPFATGLLVLLIGHSTRLATFINTEPKVYRATIRFGAQTNTDDCTGTVVREAAPPSSAAIHSAIPALTGMISQMPPAFSAKSVDGVRAYDAARRGEALNLQPADVEVIGWQIDAEREGEIDVTVTCGTGTYIRALARDLGRITDSAAHLTALRRIRSGPFDVADASTFETICSARPALQKLSVVASPG